MKDLFKFFLLLGATGFGGPLSLIQLMKEKYVTKDKSISETEFDQVFTLIKAMPGPIAFQMASFIGQRFFGFWGALIAAIALMIPSFCMIVTIAYFYDSVREIVYFKPVLDGFLYSTTAVILLSLKGMINQYKKDVLFWGILLLTLAIHLLLAVPEPILIIGFGLAVILYDSIRKSMGLGPAASLSVAFFAFDFEKIYQLFKSCLYAGAFVFGTGLAVLPVLRRDFVDIYQLLPIQEFNDGVIFGQMTPGPITITTSFLGYRISGFAGAFVAIVAVFLAPFFHIVTWFPKAVGWLTKQKWIRAFMLGATAAVVGSILFTIYKMNEDSIRNGLFWTIFLAAFIILLKRPKTPLLLIIFGGGFINLIVFLAATKTI